MELRHRPAADAGTAVDHGRAAGDARATHRDGPHDSGTAESAGNRARPAGDRPGPDNSRRYDADAEFKRAVPRPPGSLPDDTGRPSSRSGAVRPVELHHDERAPREMPRPRDAPERDTQETEESDAPHVVVDRPAIRDPLERNSPDRYADLLAGPDGTRLPCFNGPPRRDQAVQGRLRDCGVIAALGSVASHRPGDLANRVRLEPDGTYKVSLSEARRTEGGAVPTGRSVELTVTAEVPVRSAAPDEPAGAAAADGTAWGPVMEKALAGVDQAWSLQRQVAWMDAWVGICADASAANPDDPIRDPAPTGYARLNQGTDAWDRAELLTQLTGQPAEVRPFPAGDDEWRINRVIREQLQAGKPVLVSSRRQSHGREILPHKLEPEHVYEVTGVEKGKILLRNPWEEKHPEPMETAEFAHNIRRHYTTLT